MDDKAGTDTVEQKEDINAVSDKLKDNAGSKIKENELDSGFYESSRYVIIGNVDSGKSTTIGVLTKNVLDNGNGSARLLITKLKHERESGRTSSHSQHYMIKGKEIITLIDLCGHEKYLKTTIFGIMGLFADYGIVMVGANMGVIGMTMEHIAILIANRIPFIIIISKIDLCPPNVMQIVKKDLERIAKRNKKEIIYFEEDEVQIDGSYIKAQHQEIINAFQERKTSIIPIIMTSNKTGHNIEFMRELITSIKSRTYLERIGAIEPSSSIAKKMGYPTVMYIDNTFSISGIGIVLSGTVKYGPLHLGQKVFLGPVDNKYISITIKTMKNCIRENVTTIQEHDSGSIGIRLDSKGSYTRHMFSKGQIITTDMNFALKHTCYTFNSDVFIFNHPTTIRNGYQTVIHCCTIKQTGKFKFSEEKILRTNSKENIDITFLRRPEFILPGTFFTFRDGRTKGMGRITNGTPFIEDITEQNTHSTKMKGNSKRFEKKSKQLSKNPL